MKKREKTAQLYCDFECSTDSWTNEKKSYVYLWGVLEDEGNFFEYGVNIDTYFEYLNTLNQNTLIWFHNGGTYDFEFIKHWLGNHYEYVEDKIKIGQYQWNLLAKNEHDTYGIVFINKNGKRIYFRDSYKHVQKALKDDVNSSKIEQEEEYYHMVRNYKTIDDVSNEDYEYLYNDCLSLKRLINSFSSVNKLNLNRYTKTSYAWAEFSKEIKYSELYNDILTEEEWKYNNLFATGGFTWLNDDYQYKLVENITRDDVNSLYPAAMYNTPMPIGRPIKGCKIDCEHICSLIEINITCKIKENKVPFLRVGGSYRDEHIQWKDEIYRETIYITKHMLSKVFEYYEVYDYNIIKITCYNHTMGIAHKFFDKYMALKISCLKDSPEYDDAKTKMNGCFGRTFINIYQRRYFLRLIKPGEKFRKDKSIYGKYVMEYTEEVMEKIPYNALAVFILSNSKSYYLIDMMQKVGRKDLIYVDTDSITYWSRLNGINTDIHQTELGKWKKEFENMKYGYYIKRKFYLLSDTLDGPVKQIKSSKISKKNIQKYSLNDWINKTVKLRQTRRLAVEGGTLIIDKEQQIKGYNDII